MEGDSEAKTPPHHFPPVPWSDSQPQNDSHQWSAHQPNLLRPEPVAGTSRKKQVRLISDKSEISDGKKRQKVPAPNEDNESDGSGSSGKENLLDIIDSMLAI